MKRSHYDAYQPFWCRFCRPHRAFGRQRDMAAHVYESHRAELFPRNEKDRQ